MTHDVVLTFLKEEAKMKAELWTKLLFLYQDKEQLNREIEETLGELDELAS